MKIYLLYRDSPLDRETSFSNKEVFSAHTKEKILHEIERQIKQSKMFDPENILTENNFSVLGGKLGTSLTVVCFCGVWDVKEDHKPKIGASWSL